MSIKILKNLEGIPTRVEITQGSRTYIADYDVDRGFIFNRKEIPAEVYDKLQLVYPFSLRSKFWFDRNPTTIQRGYQATVAPHGTANRWTYTVPTDRKAFVESVVVTAMRITAPVAAGLTLCGVTLLPRAAANYWDVASAQFLDAAVGARDSAILGQSLILFEGDECGSFTQDASNGGTVNFRVIAKITEFDA